MIPTYLLPLANHLWQSTLFAAAAGLLTLAFRTNRAPVRYSLWLAASLKFLVPFSLLLAIGNRVEWRKATEATPAPFTFAVQQIGQPFTTRPEKPGSPAVPPPASPVPAILLGVWAAGFLASMLPWFNRWRRVRAALRVASPMPLDLPVPVMISALRLEPGIFGIHRPVLLLPEGLTEHLSPAQFDAILAHELCHVRRRDNLAAAAHMVVEAIFWFHPLLWWIERRLVEERERACDEEVLARVRDPEVYAEGILNVCKLYLGSPIACMSGVTGSNLKQRIEAIMTRRVVQNLTGAKKLLLAGAGLASVAIPIAAGMLHLPQSWAQSQAGSLAFEVASVKPNKVDDPRTGQAEFLPGGGFSAVNINLYAYIAGAYNIPLQSVRLSGGPEWIRSERFDIRGTPVKGSIPPETPAHVRMDKTRLMLQALLADRFHLRIRRETKEVPSYVVVVGKGGPKISKLPIEESDCRTDPDTAGVPCHEFNGGQGRGLHAKAATMTDLLEFASNWTDRPMIDQTGLKGFYAIDTEGWQPLRQRPARAGSDPSAEDLAFADPTTPTLFTIFERMGLKIELQKAEVEMLVIDHVERPAEN